MMSPCNLATPDNNAEGQLANNRKKPFHALKKGF